MVARIRHSTHDQLVQLAHEDTENCGRQVYVADLVREAIKNYLRNRDNTKSVLDGRVDTRDMNHNHSQLSYKS